MNFLLSDMGLHDRFKPLTLTRPVGAMRMGTLTFAERWEHVLGQLVGYDTEDYLSGKYPGEAQSDTIYLAGNVVATVDLGRAIQELQQGQVLVQDDSVIAYRNSQSTHNPFTDLEQTTYTEQVTFIEHPWDLFGQNHDVIASDFELLTQGRESQPVDDHVTLINPDQIFIEPGAKLTYCCLNATDGPIYIGRDAIVMEGATIRGPLSLGEHATIKMGAKIYTGTTIGPHCKIGGEVSNSVIMGYSNKGHDGFLGNSVLGEWCNLGADTNTSNLKNNYAPVRVWSYETQGFAKTGLQFCGLIMGDHSKSGINTMFNTGTVVGVSSNIFGSGFPRNFVPSFSWGGASGFTDYRLEKATEVAKVVMKRRSIDWSAHDEMIFQHLKKQQ